MKYKCAVFNVAVFLVLEAVLIAFMDRPLSEYLRAVDRSYPAFIDIFRAYTDFGKSAWYLWPSAFCILMCAGAVRLPGLDAKKRARFADAGQKFLFVFAAVALSGIVTDSIKPIFGRARPVVLAREGFYGFHPASFDAAWNSMPSGHATTAFALAFALIKLFPRQRPLWLAIGLLLAISRVMVNAHYLSDVIAGAAVGALTVCAARKAFEQNERNGMFHVLSRIFPIDRKNTTQ